MAGGMRGGVNPRQMQQQMKKMGIKQNEIEDVTEVIIRTRTNEIVLSNANVVLIEMQGTKNYQVTGDESVRPLGSGSVIASAQKSFPSEDIELVMSQTGCDHEKAVEALDAVDGQPAEAILKIMTG